ncbi:MAG: FG-GAP repeat domain-containing protein, partial [Planctomycetota bacterium]
MPRIPETRPDIRAALQAQAAALFIGAMASAQSVAPFTSEHSARGVTYNMMFAPPIANPQDGFGMAAADLDGDDDLDLVLLGRIDGLVGVYENNGAGLFTNRSVSSGIPATTAGCGVCAFDYDRDGDLDLYIAQKNQPARLLRNNGGFTFTNVAAAAGVAESVAATGCSVADYDGDGWPDLYLCIYATTAPNRLYRNRGDGTFENTAPALGVGSAGLSYQAVWSDYDRDGWPDLTVSNDRGFGNVPNQLWRNQQGAFVDVSAASG